MSMTPDQFAEAMGAENLGTFPEIVSKLTPDERVMCARDFEVAVSTVDRWANDTAKPHPVLKWQVVRWVMRLKKS